MPAPIVCSRLGSSVGARRQRWRPSYDHPSLSSPLHVVNLLNHTLRTRILNDDNVGSFRWSIFYSGSWPRQRETSAFCYQRSWPRERGPMIVGSGSRASGSLRGFVASGARIYRPFTCSTSPNNSENLTPSWFWGSFGSKGVSRVLGFLEAHLVRY